MLYNEKQKERYIEFKEKYTTYTEGFLQRLFMFTSTFEEIKDKDVSCFTKYEIMDMYKILSSYSLDTLLNINAQLGLYTVWCINNTTVPDSQNHFRELDNDSLAECLNKMFVQQKIISKEQILTWCNQLPNAQDAFILLSLFEYGKSKNFAELINLTISDFTGNQLHLPSRTVTVSDKLVALAQEANEATEYTSMGKTERIYPYVENGKVIKEHANCMSDDEFQKGRRLYTSVIHMLNYLGASKYINPNAVVESGKINMIKERAWELGITVTEYIDIYRQEIEHQYNCRMIPSQFISKYKSYL